MSILMGCLPLIVVLIVILAVLPSLLNGRGKERLDLPYHSKFILTNSEYKFYSAFKPLMDIHAYIICPKVGLKDLFEVNSGTQDRQKYFRRISQKHVDFLVCDAKLHPLFAIELDDKSHRRADVIERDQFKDALFAKAGLPLYRIPTTNHYSDEYIQKYITSPEQQQGPF